VKRGLLLFFFSIPSLSWATSCSGYNYERTLTIPSTNVSNVLGTLNNFPVLVSTNEVTLSTNSHLSTGVDLVFSTMSDCSFLLHWDTETVQNVNVSTMNAWVSLPVITTATLNAATFYMCYGNSGITAYQGISTGTWDSNYAGVWHLPDGRSLTAKDSTQNANNGTLNNTPTPVPGQVDGAANFVAASSQYVDVGNGSSLQITGSITESIWLNVNSFPGGDVQIMSKDSDTAGRAYTFDFVGSQNVRFYINGGSELVTSNSTIPGNTWVYLAATYDLSGNVKIYINGALDNTASFSYLAIPNNSGNLDLARREYSGFQDYLDGSIDEARVSNIARSSDWIKTEYNNQSSPSTFVAIGAETICSNTPAQNFSEVINGKVTITGGVTFK
jgi:hypothetical protein